MTFAEYDAYFYHSFALTFIEMYCARGISDGGGQLSLNFHRNKSSLSSCFLSVEDVKSAGGCVFMIVLPFFFAFNCSSSINKKMTTSKNEVLSQTLVVQHKASE